MKQIFFFLSLMIPAVLFSQPCLPEGIIFTSQEYIDNFQINHPNCTEIEGYVEIQGGDITNLDGLSVLTAFGNTLTITLTNSLTNLNGLNNVTSIGLHLQIMDNDSLINLQGLENLSSIGSALLITDNAELINLSGLEDLSSVGWKMTVSGNNNLTSLEGLNNLSTIGGEVLIELNPSLTSLEGLESLTSITGFGGSPPQGGSLLIADNVALSDLTPLINLSSIEGDLYLQGNDALTSLEGLDNIEANSIYNLWIWENQSLSTCEVQSVCDYLLVPNGQIIINDNAVGCNSMEEVMDSCMTSTIAEKTLEESFTISPNPFESNAFITYTLNQGSFVNIEIVDLYGRLVKTLVNEYQHHGDQKLSLSSDGLTSGIYFCTLRTNSPAGGQTKKIVKL